MRKKNTLINLFRRQLQAQISAMKSKETWRSLAIVFALFCLSIPSALAQCDQIQGGPGFPGDTGCQTAVCDDDAFCCTTSWDGICAGIAAVQPACCGCITVPIPPVIACPAPFTIEGCNTDVIGLPNVAPFCDEAGGLGFPGDAGCESAICANDAFCCNIAWDGICATAAAANPACSGCLSTALIAPFSTVSAPITEANFVALGGVLNSFCGVPVFSYQDVAVGTCPIVVTRTFTVVDDAATTTCDQEIIIEDTVVPVITCPANLEIEGCDISALTAGGGAGPFCDEAQGAPGFGSDAACEAVVCGADGFCCATEWDAICAAAAAAEAACSACLSTVGGNPPLSLVLANITAGEFVALGGTIVEDCNVASVTYIDTEVGICPITINRVFTVTDDCGNADACNQTITIDDATAPVITCPANLNVEGCDLDALTTGPFCDQGQGSPGFSSDPACEAAICAADAFCCNTEWDGICADAAAAEAACAGCLDTGAAAQPPFSAVLANITEAEFVALGGTIVETCNVASVTYIDVSNGTCPITINRIFTVTDDCGNIDACNQTITVDDSVAPEVSCPADFTVEGCSTADIGTGSAGPFCDEAQGSPGFAADSACETAVCGADAFCCDTEWDAICAGAAAAEAACAACVAPVVAPPFSEVTATITEAEYLAFGGTILEGCGVASVEYIDVEAGACPIVVTRTYTITDDCGNASGCTQTITIEDSTAPEITCPADFAIEGCSVGDIGDLGPFCDEAQGSPGFASDSACEAAVCGADAFCCDTEWDAICADAAAAEAACSGCLNTGAPAAAPFSDVSATITEAEYIAFGGTIIEACGVESVTYIDVAEGTCPIVVTRTYTVTDDCGNESNCVQTISIGDSTAPVITCPPGQNLTCFESVPAPITTAAGFIAAGGTLSDACTTDLGDFTVFSNSTDNGGNNCPGNAKVVVRTYFVQDACGNTSTCDQTFTYLESTQDPVITSILPACFKTCAEMANPMETDITYTTDCAFDATVNIEGPTQIGADNCPGTIYQYSYTVTDDCGRTSVPVTRDFIMENEGPTITCAPFNLILECGDDSNQSYIDAHLATVSATTSCDLGYTINHFPQSFDLTSCGASTVVTFVATDACGRTASCTTTVAVQDNVAPEFTAVPPSICDVTNCSADVNYWYNHWTNYMIDGLAAEDACDNNVSIGMMNTPLNTDCPNGDAVTVVTFTATDNCGNTAYMTGTFTVEATPTNLAMMGIVATEDSEMVETVSVTLEGNNNTSVYETADNGMYGFENLTEAQNYTVTPYLNEDPLNGVSSFDLVLIAKHILQVEELDSPYKMIAADVNGSGSISTIDLLELRKLILHIDEGFTNNTSWRFVEANFVFPQPDNPFVSSFPEIVNINGLTADEQHDFVGVKIGDVNGSVTANVMAEAEDRTVVGDLVFNIADQELKAGEVYEIAFNANNFDAIHGYQFSLGFDQTALKFEDLRTGELTNLTDNNFGLSLLEKGVITTSWTSQEAQTLAENANVFHVSFTAKIDALLSEVINVNSRYTRAEAYDGALELMDVKFRFDNAEVAANEFRLYQNVPNPFGQETVIGFDLPEAGFVTLSILDVSGRLLKQVEGDFTKGYNTVSISRDELQATGVVYYKLVTDGFEKTMKMMMVN